MNTTINQKLEALRGCLGEADSRSFPTKLLKQVASMTAKNHHTEARILVARWLKDEGHSYTKELLQAYEAVKTLTDYLGYRPNGLGQVFDKLDDELRWALKQALPEGEFTAVWTAL